MMRPRQDGPVSIVWLNICKAEQSKAKLNGSTTSHSIRSSPLARTPAAVRWYFLGSYVVILLYACTKFYVCYFVPV